MSTIVKGTGILSLGDLIGRLFEVARILLITHFFSVEAFGLFSLAIGTGLLLSGFTLPSYGSVILQYFPYYQKKGLRETQQFVSSSIFYSLVTGLLLTLVMMALTDQIAVGYFQKPELGTLLAGASLLVLISPLVNNLSQVLLSDQAFFRVFLLRIGGAVVNLLAVIVAIQMQWGLQGLVAAYVFSELFRVAFALWSLRAYCRFMLPKLSREVWLFWRPLIATSLFKGITTNLPMLIIGRFLDTLSIGLYTTAERTLKLFFSFTDPYLDTLKVVSVRTYHESRSAFIQLLNRHNEYTAVLMSAMGWLAVGLGPLTFLILYSADYAQALPYYFGLSLYVVLGSINASFPRVVFSVKNVNHYYLFSNIVFVMFLVPTMLALLPLYGLWGVVWAMFLSRIFMLALNVVLCKKAEPGFSIRSVLAPCLLYMGLVAVGAAAVTRLDLPLAPMGLFFLVITLGLAQLFGWIDVRLLRSILKNRAVHPFMKGS